MAGENHIHQCRRARFPFRGECGIALVSMVISFYCNMMFYGRYLSCAGRTWVEDSPPLVFASLVGV